jgi:uncharacterized protein with ParB-like and HNH nuclease domain
MAMELPQSTHSNFVKLFTDIESGEIKIPQFPRDFVWSLQSSATLLDSIVKGYPVWTLYSGPHVRGSEVYET